MRLLSLLRPLSPLRLLSPSRLLSPFPSLCPFPLLLPHPLLALRRPCWRFADSETLARMPESCARRSCRLRSRLLLCCAPFRLVEPPLELEEAELPEELLVVPLEETTVDVPMVETVVEPLEETTVVTTVETVVTTAETAEVTRRRLLLPSALRSRLPLVADLPSVLLLTSVRLPSVLK